MASQPEPAPIIIQQVAPAKPPKKQPKPTPAPAPPAPPPAVAAPVPNRPEPASDSSTTNRKSASGRTGKAQLRNDRFAQAPGVGLTLPR